jgi:flagellar M-ring protein FliF
MKGIENAYVLYDTEQRSGLSGERLKTASVSVKPLGTEQLEESRVSAIRYLVAGAIAGLKPENVTVADLNGNVFRGGDPENGAENQYMALKQKHERALRAKILDALKYIPGVTAECTVKLEKERSTHVEQLKVDPKTVNLEIIEKTKTRNQDGSSGSGGRPGVQTQQANAPSSLAPGSSSGKGSHEEEDNGETKTHSEPVLREHTEKENVGLTPKRATVAVGIPSSYFEKVWRERNPVKEGDAPKTPDPAALDAIREEILSQERKHVATLLTPLLPPEAAANATDLVAITTFQDIKPGAMPVPSTAQNVLAWLGQHWSTLGLLGLVLAGLVMLRSMVRRVRGPEAAATPLRVAATPETATEEKEPAEVVAARRLRRLAAGEPSLRDELSDLVKEDPDAAANILRTWIGQAG